MKKIILGLGVALMSAASWGACTYNFDMTQAQLEDARTKNTGAYPVNFFPNNSGSKVGYNIQNGSQSYIAMSKAKVNLTATNDYQGDKTVVNSGIIAFEYKIKVPTPLTNAGVTVFPLYVTGKLNNNQSFASALIMSYGQMNDNSVNSFYINMDSNIDGALNLSKKLLGPYTVANTVDGYQKIGYYINQNTKQVGLIVNGTNLGYVLNLSDKLKDIGFSIVAFSDANNQLPSSLGKEVSFEVVTNRSQFTYQYPTGTTDICGATI